MTLGRCSAARRLRDIGVALTAMLSAALLIGACGQSLSSVQDDLDTATAVWMSDVPSSYTLAYERRCLCANAGAFLAEVTDGVVSSVEPAQGIGGVDEINSALTVERLFATVQGAIDREAEVVEVDYDGERGYPVRIFIDADRGGEDDELTVTAELTNPS
jgi:hypothetical protein